MKPANPLRSLVLLLLLLPSCKPAPGSACDRGEARCLDARRELVCDDGKFIETPCRGPGGCSTLQETTSCDISGNRAGDPCSRTEEGAAACAEPNRMIACHAGRFADVPCRGPRGCESVAGQPHCDQSVAEPGDACKLPNAKSCSQDKQSVLSCLNGRLAPLYLCRGQAGCSSAGGKLSCDQTVARLKDACDKGLDGHVACSEDRRGLLACSAESFVASEKCKAGTECVVSGQSTRCTKPD